MNGNDAIITISATALGITVGTIDMHDNGPLTSTPGLSLTR